MHPHSVSGTGTFMEGLSGELDCYTLPDKSPAEKIGTPRLETLDPYLLPDPLGFIVVPKLTRS